MALTPDFFNHADWSVWHIAFHAATWFEAASFVLWKCDTLKKQWRRLFKRK